jgi:hypothetical protein
LGELFLGGGGPYSGPPSRTTEEGEEIFKSAVEEAKHAGVPKKQRIFISHAWEYGDDYRRMEKMLDEASDFDYADYSVPEHDPLHTKTKKELIDALYNQIRPTNVVIVLAGMYVPYREWIQKEIDIALELGKPIIGVVPWGSTKVPRAIQDVADEIVGWNTRSITDAIRRVSKQ